MGIVIKKKEYFVGDKVKIVDKWGRMCFPNPAGLMDQYLGKTVTITGKFSYGSPAYTIKEDNGRWAWYTDSIEGLVVETN